MDTALIIGGGMGGLFTGAYLARNGYRVTVLEKNPTIGGGLQCFVRHGKLYDTGMHVMGEFQNQGTLFRICRYLGIDGQLDVHCIDPQFSAEVQYGHNGRRYRIPSGREAFVQALSDCFPDQAEGIRAYVDRIYALTAELPLYSLKPEPLGQIVHSDMFYWPADKLIAHYVSDHELRELLAYLNALYSGTAGHTPAYVHSLVNVMFINGASRFVDGSQQLADALAGVIRRAGGLVLADCPVTNIEVHDRRISAVITADGRRFTADSYISAIHPLTLTALLPAGALPKSFTRRLEQIDDSCSAFSLYIDLEPDSLPYIPHTCYYMERPSAVWDQHLVPADQWPQGLMYMTPPDRGQGAYASRLLVHCSMSFDEVEPWAHTSAPGRRGADYQAWKAERTQRVLDRLEVALPGIRSKIRHVYASSPLTVRDYYNTRRGAIFGYRKDCHNLTLSQLQVRTKIPNLLLTGQNVNMHGICGVALTAVTTAEALLGHSHIINQINHAQDLH